MVVGGALAWSIGTVVAARGIRGRAEPLALAGWQMTAGGVALAARRGGGGGRAPRRPARARSALIVGLALVGSAPPLALFYLALGARRRRREVSAWFFLVPVVGVLTAWPLLGETPSARLGDRHGGGLGGALAGARAGGPPRGGGW